MFQHLVTTYASETNKTASMWRAIPDNLLDYRPHQKTNTIRAILIHQIHSEWRFFAQFVGTRHRLALHEPPPAMLEWCERVARIAQQEGHVEGGRGREQGRAAQEQIQRAAGLLKHISDPTRLQVIGLLSERERHVGGLCEELTQRQPAVSHHLTLLRLGGIIDRRRQGKNNFYSLTHTGERLSDIVKGVVR